jgi:hypothetical protein
MEQSFELLLCGAHAGAVNMWKHIVTLHGAYIVLGFHTNGSQLVWTTLLSELSNICYLVHWLLWRSRNPEFFTIVKILDAMYAA